jgi:L-serine kinase (ATP) / ParB family transcriptional regulator, heme-responsive regulator
VELSLRRRPAAPPARGGAVPLLRVWATERLLLHEEADGVRVRRLVNALRRDGVLRNPPIVAPLEDGRAVVLDGANRVTALRSLGLPHVVAQQVAYDDPDVRLSVWRHHVAEDTPGALRAAVSAAGLGITGPVEDEAGAESQVAARGLAAIVDALGGVVVRHAAGPGEIDAAGAEVLCRLAALYRDDRAVHRVEAGSLDELRAAYGPGALVLFHPFEKSDILALSLAGGRLPAGITRHVIPGRALRLNTPLAWLADRIDPGVKQAALDAQLQQRWQAHGVRYYAEPTFSFDE